MIVEVKVCGVCSAADGRMASEAGATHVGVILAPGRSRTRTLAEAEAILAEVRARRVGVFVDEAPRDVAAAARSLGLDAVQLHGDESAEYVQELRGLVGAEIWKAVRVRAPADVRAGADRFAGLVDALLLDGWSATAPGGTGAAFDWQAIAHANAPPAGVRLIVAGGLTPDNVAAAVSLLRPAIVDVSSGVEREPGRKSAALMHAFVAAARGVKDRE